MSYDLVLWDCKEFSSDYARDLYVSVGGSVILFKPSIAILLCAGEIDLQFKGGNLLPLDFGLFSAVPYTLRRTVVDIVSQSQSLTRVLGWPWAGTAYIGGIAMSLSISPSGISAALPVVRRAASEFGLSLYDPQLNEVWQEGEPQASKAGSALLPTRLRLEVMSGGDHVECALFLDERQILNRPVASREMAHFLAMKQAVMEDTFLYRVHDPLSLSQEWRSRISTSPDQQGYVVGLLKDYKPSKKE